MAFGQAQKHVIAAAETTPAAPGTAASAGAAKGIGVYRSIRIVTTRQGATGGVLDIYLQSSWDGGTTWIDIGHYAQLSAGASAVTDTIMFSREQMGTTAVVVGSGLSPALAANTFLQGEFGDMLRAVYVAGSGTSSGAPVTISVYGVRQNY